MPAAPEPVALSTSEKATLRHLVQVVARAFYDPKQVIVLDQLTKWVAVPADELAKWLMVVPKELAKLSAPLLEDRLVATHRHPETKEGVPGRVFHRTYYYVDYKTFIDVVKWKLFKVEKSIQDRLRKERENKGYVCPQCNKSFSMLEAMSFIDPFTGQFMCDTCSIELVENENAESVKGSEDRLRRLNTQTKPIVDALKKTADLTLPHLDVGDWVDKLVKNPSDVNGADGQAGANGTRGPSNFSVELAGDEDEAKRRAMLQAQAEAQRTQNAIPSWHLQSTVSGELTALGIKERTTASGLGFGAEEEEKLGGEEEVDAYEQYYANLDSGAPSLLGEDDDDDFEEVTPAGSQLSSSALPSIGPDGKKAKRPREDADGDSDGKVEKKVRWDGASASGSAQTPAGEGDGDRGEGGEGESDDSDEDDFEEVI